MRFGPADAAITLVGAASLAFAVVCLAASVGVWRSATWGWALALAVAVIGLLSIVTAVLSGGGTWELAGGVILFGGLLACLLSPAVRSRAGIG